MQIEDLRDVKFKQGPDEASILEARKRLFPNEWNKDGVTWFHTLALIHPHSLFSEENYVENVLAAMKRKKGSENGRVARVQREVPASLTGDRYTKGDFIDAYYGLFYRDESITD